MFSVTIAIWYFGDYVEKDFKFKYVFACVISSINFDGNDGGKLYPTRNRQ